MQANRKTSLGLAVIGAGAWGTTLAMVACRAGTPTTLVVRDRAAFAALAQERRHPVSLEGVTIPEELEVANDAGAAVREADIVLLVVPTQKLRAAVGSLADSLQGKILVSAAKGIEIGTSTLPTQIIEQELGDHTATRIVALSGPNLAGEIALGKPATAVVAGKDADALEAARDALMGDTFRVYTSPDVIGVQIGGALKNVIAIGAGIGDGLHAGDNAKAAFMTRGIAEIARLGVALGADPLTFAGLSGIGDLICTCSSNLSRNHRVGMGLAEGKPLDQVVADLRETAEGVDTTRAAVELAARHGVEMPIASEMFNVLFTGKSPVAAVQSLMMREPASELR